MLVKCVNCPSFPESNRLNKRAGNLKEGIHAGEKAQPEATSRTPRTRSSAIQGKSSRLLPLHASPMAHPGGARRRSSADKAGIKELERENKKLRTANEILKKVSACFARAELDRSFRR